MYKRQFVYHARRYTSALFFTARLLCRIAVLVRENFVYMLDACTYRWQNERTFYRSSDSMWKIGPSISTFNQTFYKVTHLFKTPIGLNSTHSAWVRIICKTVQLPLIDSQLDHERCSGLNVKRIHALFIITPEGDSKTFVCFCQKVYCTVCKCENCKLVCQECNEFVNVVLSLLKLIT